MILMHSNSMNKLFCLLITFAAVSLNSCSNLEDALAQFLRIYREIWKVENQFPESPFNSYDEMIGVSNYNYYTMFISRITQPDQKPSLADQAMEALQRIYENTRSDKLSACRNMIKMAVVEVGPIDSFYLLRTCREDRLVDETEFLEWAKSSKQTGSVLFRWRYPHL